MRQQLDSDLPRYYDYLRGAKFETAWTELRVLPLKSSLRGAQVAVPIDPATRQHMDSIEAFVRDNVVIPAELQACKGIYKPLYRGPSLFVEVDEYCTCFVFDVKTRSIQMKVDEDYPVFDVQKPFDMIPVKEFRNRRARYRFKLNLSKVYIGPHANGALVSLIPSLDAIDVDC